MSGASNAVILYLSLCDKYGVKPNPKLMAALDGHSCRTIHEINLSNGYYGTKQAQVIVEMVPECPALEKINLSGNSISSSVVESLCNGLDKSVVGSVVLDGNLLDITSGLRLLETLRKNPAIISLRVEKTMLPEYLVEDLRVQQELNALHLRKKESEKRESVKRLVDAPPRFLDDFNFDEISNADDMDDIADVEDDDSFSHDGVGKQAQHGRGESVLNAQDADTIAAFVSNTMTSSQVFTDDSFSPGMWNLQVKKKAGVGSVKWMRFGELCAKKGLVPTCNGASPLHYGVLPGLKWVYSALSAVREIDYLRFGVCSRALADLGLYVFSFVIDRGAAVVQVVVDDLLPVFVDVNGTTTLATVFHEDPSDGWGALVLKAYAKMHNGYAKLQCGGSLRSAIADVTGGACFKTKWTISTLRFHRESTYQWLRDHVVNKRVLLAKATAQGSLQRSSHDAAGIVSNCAYVVSNAMILGCSDPHEPTAFGVQLTSPVTSAVWRGRLGPGSLEEEKYDGVRQTTRGRSFWMLLEDFVAFFDSVYVLRHVGKQDLSLRTLCLRNIVTPEAPGAESLRYGDPFWGLNPAFLLQTTLKEATVVLSVHQSNRRASVEHFASQWPVGIQCHVHTLGENHDRRFVFQGKDLASSGDANDFVFGRDALVCVVVRRDKPLQVTLSSSAPGAALKVVATSSAQFSLDRHQDSIVRHATIASAWQGECATGNLLARQKQMSVSRQFAVVLDDTAIKQNTSCDVTLWLTQSSASQFTIGLVGQYTQERVSSTDDIDDALTIPFVRQSSVATTFTLTSAKSCCVVVPMTWNDGEECSFALTCFSLNHSVRLVELPTVQSKR